MNNLSFAIVLPARYGSERFPGKPLAMIAGRPLIEWVHERALQVRGAGRVIVATDDDRIADVVRGFGGDVSVTGECATGTDRVAEVARHLPFDIIVNLQGDEPVFDPAMVEDMIAMLGARPEFDIATAYHRIEDRREFENPNVVKVIIGENGRALYFSRAPLPYGGLGGDYQPMRHVGIYAYRKEVLARFASLPATALELSESLEQLRALANGMAIGVVETARMTVGVDVPDDVKNVEKEISRT